MTEKQKLALERGQIRRATRCILGQLYILSRFKKDHYNLMGRTAISTMINQIGVLEHEFEDVNTRLGFKKSKPIKIDDII